MYGLCSNGLATLKPNEKAVFRIRKETFKFHYAKPMIFAGPGTAIAPFRFLLLDKGRAIGSDLNSCLVFFGCRKQKKDYYCDARVRDIRAKPGEPGLPVLSHL